MCILTYTHKIYENRLSRHTAVSTRASDVCVCRGPFSPAAGHIGRPGEPERCKKNGRGVQAAALGAAKNENGERDREEGCAYRKKNGAGATTKLRLLSLCLVLDRLE